MHLWVIWKSLTLHFRDLSPLVSAHHVFFWRTKSQQLCNLWWCILAMSRKICLLWGCDLRITWSHTCTFPHIGKFVNKNYQIEVMKNTNSYHERRLQKSGLSLFAISHLYTKSMAKADTGQVRSSFARNAPVHSLFPFCKSEWVMSATTHALTPHSRHQTLTGFVFPSFLRR